MGERKKPPGDTWSVFEIQAKLPQERSVEERIALILHDLSWSRIGSILDVEALGLLTEEIKNNPEVRSAVQEVVNSQNGALVLMILRSMSTYKEHLT